MAFERRVLGGDERLVELEGGHHDGFDVEAVRETLHAGGTAFLTEHLRPG